MCVPGVHACATAGVSTSASNTASPMAPAETARGEARVIAPRLNPDPLTLPANCFSEVVQLVLHDVIDRIASGVDVVPDLLDHVVDGDSIDQLLTTLDGRPEAPLRTRSRPPRSFGGATTRPAGALESAASGPFRSLDPCQSGERGTSSRVPHQRADGPTPGRPPTQQQRDSGADCRADQRGGQQVVLLLTLVFQIRLWVGLAGAVFPNRRLCLRRSPHRSNPPRQMPD